jgi:hypothetical protein
MSLMKWRNDEIHGVPHPLGSPLGDDLAYEDNPDTDWAYSIGGIHFLSAASDNYPYQRQLTKLVKDQFDTSDNPGDNSLEGWWVRSQSDWSLGSDQLFMESMSDDTVSRRFWKSAGMDVFTRPGEMSLLPRMEMFDLSAAGLPASAVKGSMAVSKDAVFISYGTKVVKVQGTSVTAITASGVVQGLTIAGDHLLIELPTVVQTTPLAAFTTPTDAFTNVVNPKTWWVKSRCMVSSGQTMYEIPGALGGAAVDVTKSTVKFDMGDPSWVWTGVASGPQEILFSGYGDAGSSILATVLDNEGKLPTLSALLTVAEFPATERVEDIATYLGTYIAISTSAGIRVGQLVDRGGVQYGPLLGSPVSATHDGGFSMFDRFVAYPTADAGDGRPGIVLVDLSEIGEDGRAPWANWLRLPAGSASVDAAVVTGPRAAFMMDHAGNLWHASATVLDKGWLDTSQIRFGTWEGKTFESVKVILSSNPGGSVEVSSLSPEWKPVSLGTVVTGMGTEAKFDVGARHSTSSMAVRFDVQPDGAGTLAPVITAWSMKAWPTSDNRGETVLLPLLNFDFERDTFGVPSGYEGRAAKRWQDLVKRLTSGRTILVEERASGMVYTGITEDASFTQVAPPTRASGFGGIVQISFRTTR